MSLISLLIAIIIIGLLVYLIQVLPIPEPFRTAAYVVLVILVILWLVEGFGVFDGPRVV